MIRSGIATFYDAFDSLPDTDTAKITYKIITDSANLSKSVHAYLKLRVIVSAFNSQRRSSANGYYEPHYRFEDGEMITMFPRISSNRLMGFVNKRDAIYAANTFKELYKDYYLG